MLTFACFPLQAATPLSAVLQFFLRDLSGMLGGVTFAFLQAGTAQYCIHSCLCVPYRDSMCQLQAIACRGPGWTSMLNSGDCLLTA